MSDSHTKEVKELKHELERIDKGGMNECVMCRFVLIFAFIVLLLVLTFTFFFRMENRSGTLEGKVFVPTPVANSPLPSSEEWNICLIDLGQAVDASASPISPPVPSVKP